MAAIDFPNLGLEAVGLGLFWGNTLGELKVGASVAVFEFSWNGGGSSPI